MASMITHAAVGTAAAIAFAPPGAPHQFWAVAILSSTIADADAISFLIPGRVSDLWSHRGFLHSLFFGFLLSFFFLAVFFRDTEAFSGKWFFYFNFFFLVFAGHGFLDALTKGGYGVAFFAPFDNTRYAFPWSPILVSPIRLSSFFSKWGLAVMKNEMRCVWIPSFSIAILSKILRTLI